MKLDKNATTCCLAVAPRGFVSSGTHSLLLGTEVREGGAGH
jgi:hypothetical protein